MKMSCKNNCRGFDVNKKEILKYEDISNENVINKINKIAKARKFLKTKKLIKKVKIMTE